MTVLIVGGVSLGTFIELKTSVALTSMDQLGGRWANE
jgi:hypothetical protein